MENNLIWDVPIEHFTGKILSDRIQNYPDNAELYFEQEYRDKDFYYDYKNFHTKISKITLNYGNEIVEKHIVLYEERCEHCGK